MLTNFELGRVSRCERTGLALRGMRRRLGTAGSGLAVLGFALATLSPCVCAQDFSAQDFSGYGRDRSLTPDSLTIKDAQTNGQAAHGIHYVRERIPEITLPGFEGRTYSALVPATYDVEERMELAIHALTHLVDPDYDYETYEVGVFNSDPMMPYISKAMLGGQTSGTQKLRLAPLGLHSYHAYNGVQAKMIESLGLLRSLSGSTRNPDVETGMVATMLHMFGEDGLYYMPVEGRPWALFDEWGSFIEHSRPPKETAHLAALWPMGRAIQALCVYAARDPGNPVWREYLDRAMNGLSRLMIERDDWGYFPGDLVFLDKDLKRIAYAKSNYAGDGAAHVDEQTSPTIGLNSISMSTTILYGVSRYYKLTGSPEAGNLSRRLAKYLLDHTGSLEPDGTFYHHFHLNTTHLLALLEYATAFDDQAALERVVKGYAYARSLGIPELGYWPESLPAAGQPFAEGITCEGCGVGDMVVLAIKLSRYGIGDYWEDADRYIRNQFAEAQLTRTDWIAAYNKAGIAEGQEWLSPAETLPQFVIPSVITTDDIAGRSLGTFSTWSLPHDWLPDDHIGWTGCCLGNGTRALFFVADGILEHSSGTLTLNLLLNRTSPWADVDSYLPFEGRVTIRIKEGSRLRVRIPEYVTEWDSVRCKVDGAPRSFTHAKRYADLGWVRAGAEVEIEIPQPTRTIKHTMTFARKYVPEITMTLKGNTVVELLPRGKNNPLYDRGYYLIGTPLYKRTTRTEVKNVPEGLDTM